MKKRKPSKVSQWLKYGQGLPLTRLPTADMGSPVGYGTDAPSTPIEYPDMPETRRVWLQTEAARREAAYFDAHPDERPKGGLVKVSTLLKAWFPMETMKP